MGLTKVTEKELNPSKTVDANGWTVYDYGAWKEYKKRVTFSQTISGGAGLSISSSNLPVGVSSLSGHFLHYSLMAGGNAYALSVVFEGGSTATSLGFTTNTNDGVSRAYTGDVYLTITSA